MFFVYQCRMRIDVCGPVSLSSNIESIYRKEYIKLVIHFDEFKREKKNSNIRSCSECVRPRNRSSDEKHISTLLLKPKYTNHFECLTTKLYWHQIQSNLETMYLFLLKLMLGCCVCVCAYANWNKTKMYMMSVNDMKEQQTLQWKNFKPTVICLE